MGKHRPLGNNTQSNIKKAFNLWESLKLPGSTLSSEPNLEGEARHALLILQKRTIFILIVALHVLYV